MKIKSIYVNNFKSLVDFKIDLAKFNCLIGLNGSGKSTFLQFISFLSQLMKRNKNIDGWLQKRKWTKEDIVPHFDNKTNRTIQFEIQFQCDDQHGYWKCDYSADHSRSIYEKFTLGEVELEVFNQSEQSDKYTFQGKSNGKN